MLKPVHSVVAAATGARRLGEVGRRQINKLIRLIVLYSTNSLPANHATPSPPTLPPRRAVSVFPRLSVDAGVSKRTVDIIRWKTCTGVRCEVFDIGPMSGYYYSRNDCRDDAPPLMRSKSIFFNSSTDLLERVDYESDVPSS